VIPMRAQAIYRHRGVLLRPGDRFEVATDAEARELVAVRFATRADVAALEQPPTPKRGTYDRRDMRAKP